MKDHTKYQGVIPAFYACYDKEGNVSAEGVKALTRHLIAWAALRASASTSTPTSARPCWKPS